MPQGGPVCIPLSSENVKTCASQAWKEVRPIAESLPKPKFSTLARFFPTDACTAPIDAAVLELKSQPTDAQLPVQTSAYKIGGFVFFSGRSQVGQNPQNPQNFTIMIPLYIDGEIYVDGSALDVDHYYCITRKCDIDVSRDAKLVALVIDFE